MSKRNKTKTIKASDCGSDLLDKIKLRRKALTAEQQRFYSEIVQQLQRRHNLFIPRNEAQAYFPRLRGYDYNKFEHAYNSVQGFIKDNLPYCHEHKRTRFYRVLIEQSVRSLESEHKSVGIKGVVGKLSNPKHLLDQAFPGYTEAGLLKWLIE